MKHPIYFLMATGAAGYLYLANARGWSLVHTMSPARLFSSHSSGFHHK